MTESEVERWCQQNNWTEPRQLQTGVWVAFPPGGVIETPIPLQVQTAKDKPIQEFFALVLLALLTLVLAAIALIMSPLFIEPMINRFIDDDDA